MRVRSRETCVQPDAAADDEAEVARRAISDRGAFAELYDRYVGRVHAYCLRRLGDVQAAEDATSVVFMKALAAISRYRPESGTFRSWLFVIAHNVIVDEERRRRPTSSIETAAEIRETGPGPEAWTIARDEAARLRAILARLPVDQAETLELRLAGLNDREIAQVLGRSHGAIRIAQHRAIRRLRAIYADEDDDSGERHDG